MNELQKKQLEILKEFDRVCRENNLTYFANGGTCIGAIRHNGFIPWDDDVDVMMPREDYEKLLKLQNPWSDSKYFLQTFRTDKHYVLNFAKLRDSSTTYLESLFYNIRQNHGVWIDIFPLDGIST
jgi:lipopolysaccharide cholinephosphotransferase